MTDYSINADPWEVKVQTGNVKAWISLTFAESWYTDAVEQSKLAKTRDAIGREVLFAVCAAESYLYEWVQIVYSSTRFCP